jgi:hypothetical protein
MSSVLFSPYRAGRVDFGPVLHCGRRERWGPGVRLRKRLCDGAGVILG